MERVVPVEKELKMLEKFKLLGADFTLLEVQTISLYIQGIGRKQVAVLFDVSEPAIHQRLKVIYLKLGVHNDVALTNCARDNGFDLKGNLNGTYLFEGVDKSLPWLQEPELE